MSGLSLNRSTTGLLFATAALNPLVDAGNIVIEHNLDASKTADWVIDMAPEGAPDVGQIIAQEKAYDVARVANSYAGQFLRMGL